MTGSLERNRLSGICSCIFRTRRHPVEKRPDGRRGGPHATLGPADIAAAQSFQGITPRGTRLAKAFIATMMITVAATVTTDIAAASVV